LDEQPPHPAVARLRERPAAGGLVDAPDAPVVERRAITSLVRPICPRLVASDGVREPIPPLSCLP